MKARTVKMLGWILALCALVCMGCVAEDAAQQEDIEQTAHADGALCDVYTSDFCFASPPPNGRPCTVDSDCGVNGPCWEMRCIAHVCIAQPFAVESVCTCGGGALRSCELGGKCTGPVLGAFPQ